MNHTRTPAMSTTGRARILLVGLTLALGAGACRNGRNALPAAPQFDGGAVANTPGTPPATPGLDGPSLGIVLLSKQPSYKLHGGEEQIPARLHELQERLTAPPKARPGKQKAEQGPPDAPQVDMTLRIVNRSKQRVDFWSDGDAVTVTLRLEGAGAVTAPMPVMHTMEMRSPKVVTLGPGETFDLPVTKLEFGERGDSIRAYWTRPGDYEIVPSFETAVRPAWPGTSPAGEGFGRVMLAGPPLRVHVLPR